MSDFANEFSPSVSFVGAWQCFFSNFGVFSGSANKSEFWWVIVCGCIVNPILWILTETVGNSASGEDVDLNGLGVCLFLLLLAYDFVLLIPSISLTVSSLHDMNMSGWWFFINFVPFVGFIIVLVLAAMGSSVEGFRFDGSVQPWHPEM